MAKLCTLIPHFLDLARHHGIMLSLFRIPPFSNKASAVYINVPSESKNRPQHDFPAMNSLVVSAGPVVAVENDHVVAHGGVVVNAVQGRDLNRIGLGFLSAGYGHLAAIEFHDHLKVTVYGIQTGFREQIGQSIKIHGHAVVVQYEQACGHENGTNY